jgi:hypothetical protein
MAPNGWAAAPPETAFVHFMYIESKINYTGYSDFAIDYGHDGRWDWNTSALSSETSLAFNLTDINAKTCGTNTTCAYPIYIYSQSGNQPMTIRNISLLANTSNIPLNYTPIQLFANQNGNLTSASTPWKINATAWGNVTVRDINITYAGSQDYNVTCYNSTNAVSYPMHVAYSNISVGFPGNVRFYTFAATNATQLNLTPWGQTSTQSSMNITTTNPALTENVSIYFNSTLPPGMNITFSISGNKSGGVSMNPYNNSASRWVPITNSSYGNVTQFWFWTDMNASCTQTWYDKWFIIEPICYKCVRDW